MLRIITKYIFLYGCVILVLPTVAISSPVNVFKFAIDEDNYPYSYRGSLGEPKGIYVDLIRNSFNNSKYNIKVEMVPWRRALAYLDRGTHAVVGIYANRDRLNKYTYSLPIGKEEICLYGLRRATPSFYSKEKILKGRLGVRSGWFYSDRIDAAIQSGQVVPVSSGSDSINVLRLEHGRINYALLSCEYLEHSKRSVLEILDAIVENPTYVAFPKLGSWLPIAKYFNSQL